MRKYANLKKPFRYDSGDPVYKIMLYETEDGVYLFEYCSPDAVQCSFDRYYESADEVYDDWNGLIDETGWIELEDPLPGCQHDALIPLRIKGRDTGNPEWGTYETLADGKWVSYKPQ
jgi:hypothetical protein